MSIFVCYTGIPHSQQSPPRQFTQFPGNTNGYQTTPMLLLCILTIMSFRWNHSMREPSDRSFMLQGNELVATSIGLTANRTMLSCVMNMDGKDYKYYKSDAEILEAMPNVYIKQKQWAFREIQKSTHYHRDVTNTIFLPEALNHGNYSAMSKFLEKLRTNRVGAYVKLSLQESKGYFQKAATLLKPATKMVRQRLRFGFVRLKRNMLEDRSREEKRLILEDIDKISSIENKDSEMSERKVKPKHNTVNISYTLIRVDTSRSKRESTAVPSSPSTPLRNKPKEIELTQLLQETHSKQYQFQNVEISRFYNSTRTKSLKRHA